MAQEKLHTTYICTCLSKLSGSHKEHNAENFNNLFRAHTFKVEFGHTHCRCVTNRIDQMS
jgi:hypothetical protein